MLREVANQIGIEPEALAFAFVMLTIAPFAFIHSCIPTRFANSRHTFNLVVGLFQCWLIWGMGMIHAVVMALGTWFILLTLSAQHGRIAIFIWAFGYLFAAHIWRSITYWGDGAVDFSTLMMAIVLKMTILGTNICDNELPSKEGLPPARIKGACSRPSFFHFAGYTFFFCSNLTVPQFEFKTYERLMNGDLFPGGRVPSTIKQAIKPFLLGCLFLLITVTIAMPYFPVVSIIEEPWISRPLLARIGYLMLLGPTQRVRYYAAFVLGEAGLMASGASFTGFDEVTGKIKLDGLPMLDILSIEFGTSFRMMMNSWNMGASGWLRDYVYMPLSPMIGATGARFSAFALSAFWHGIYASYYTSFIGAAFFLEAGRRLRRCVRPLFLKEDGSSPLYDVIGWAGALMAFNATGTGFGLNDLSKVMAFYHLIAFAPHIDAAIAVFVVPVVMPGKGKKKKRE